jgi:signal transduction histidine kinase
MSEPRDLDAALAALEERKREIDRLNRELHETNQGVLALYAELDDRAEMLRHVNDLKDQFLSHLSHEFRTPLNSIGALSKLMMDEVSGELNAEQKTQAGFIQKAAADLLEMVNDLLDLAKIEAGRLEVRTEPASVEDILAGLRGVFRPLVAGGEVELVFEDAPIVEGFRTDTSKLTQILRNLISNALKFTERGEDGWQAW